MKTLVKPRMKTTIASSCGYLNQNKRIEILHSKKINFIKYTKYLILLLSFTIILKIPESPVTSSTICNKYNNAVVCNVW